MLVLIPTHFEHAFSTLYLCSSNTLWCVNLHNTAAALNLLPSISSLLIVPPPVFPTPVQTSIHIDPETKLTPTPHRISIDPIPSTHPASARRTPRYLRRCTTRRARPQRASTAGIAALSFREGFLWSVL